MLGLLFWAFFFKSGFEVGGRLDRLMAGGWRHPEMSDIGTFLKYRLPDFPKRLRPRHADWTSILYSRYRFRVYRVRRSGPWPPQDKSRRVQGLCLLFLGWGAGFVWG